MSDAFIERDKGKKAQSGSSAMSLQALLVVYLYKKVNDDFIVDIIFISSLLLQSVTIGGNIKFQTHMCDVLARLMSWIISFLCFIHQLCFYMLHKNYVFSLI